MQKLYTVAELHATLPKGTTSADRLKAAIKKAGTYRNVAGEVLLTDGDWRQYLEHVNGRRLNPNAEPGEAEVGMMLVMTPPYLSADKRCALDWCLRHDELHVLRRWQDTNVEHLEILTTCRLTYGEYKAYVETLKSPRSTQWLGGYWFDWPQISSSVTELIHQRGPR